MSFHGFDPGDRNNWYQSPQLGLLPTSPTGYSGGYYCLSYSHPHVTQFPSQPSYRPLPSQFPFQTSYSPPPPPSHTIINGFVFPHQFPSTHTHHSPDSNPNPWIYPSISQSHSYDPSVTSVNSHSVSTKTMPTSPVYHSAPSIPTFQSSSVSTFLPQHQFTDPKPLPLHSKPFRGCRCRVVMGATARVSKKTRNPDLLRDVGKYSRSKRYPKRSLWVIKAKNGDIFPRHNAKATVAIMEELHQLLVGQKTPITEPAWSPLKFGSLPAGSVAPTAANGSSSMLSASSRDDNVDKDDEGGNECVIFGSSAASKKLLKELQQESNTGSDSGAESYGDHSLSYNDDSQRVDGKIVTVERNDDLMRDDKDDEDREREQNVECSQVDGMSVHVSSSNGEHEATGVVGDIPLDIPAVAVNLAGINESAHDVGVKISEDVKHYHHLVTDLNNAGDVVDRWIGRTMIRSCCKLSYEHAQDIIDGKFNSESFDTFKDGCPQIHGQFDWSDVIRYVKNLYEVSKTVKERRFSDGALQLDNSKVVILFDEYGDPYDSLFSERKESNSLVEEFMLLANRTAAEVISRAFPNSALLRRHPEPNLRKLKEFEAFCSKHGLELDTSSSGRFHQSERIRDKLKDDSVLFNILMNYATKPIQLATYFCSGELKHKENDWGHYGLVVPLYTHFTSPLRRYPDIVVHRTLAAAIEAEELYLEHQRLLNNLNRGDKFKMRCFSLPLSLLGNDYFKSTLLITDVMGVSMRSNEAPLLILLIVIMHSQTMECEISSNLLQSPNREALRVFSNMQNLYHQQSNSNSHVSVHLCAPLHAWQVTTDDGTAFGAALINIKDLNMKHSTLWYVPLLTCDIPHAVLWLGYLQVDYNLGCDLMTMDNERELVLYTGYQTPQICWSIAYESRKSINNISGKICSVSLVSNSLNLYDRTKSLLRQFTISPNKDQTAFWAAVLGQDGSITFLKFQKGSSVVVEATKISQESCSLPEHCESYLVCYFDGWCQYQLSSLLSSCFNCKSPALRTCNSSKSSVDSLYVYQKLDYFALGFTEPSMKSNFSSCKEAHPGELPDGIQLAVIMIEGKFQGQIVLRAEFTILKKIQNAQLVKLRGFCAKGLHRLLVYEYTAKRSLDEWIFKKKKDDHFLDWNTRFSIALGTAKGLAYLHEECNEKIVYCDIKPENVLPENGMQIVHWRSIGRQSCFYLQGDFVSFYIGASISIISEGYLEFGIHLRYANSYSTIMQCNQCSSFKISEFFRQAILYKNLLFLAAATHALSTHRKLMLTGYYSNSTFGHHTDTGVTIPCILQFSLPSHEDMASFKGAGLLGSQLVRWVMYWACMVYIYLGLIILWGIGSGDHAYGSLGIVNCSVI